MLELLLLLPLLKGANDPVAPALRVWREAGPPDESLDVLLVGEGYTREDYDGGRFEQDAERFVERWLEERPFRSYRERIGIRAYELVSRESGCDPSVFRDEADTALDAYFDNERGRVLKIRDEERLARLVREVGAVDVVFVVVNTNRYGGSGSVLPEVVVRDRPCPAPVFAAGHPDGAAIALHELGHSFAGLTDEYADPPLQRRYRLSWKRDIAHPNATRRGRFDASSRDALRRTLKWAHFLDLPGADEFPWLHEGAYYRELGCFRPWETCRMRSSRDPFCPVCCEQIAKSLSAACGLAWDAERHHRDHPLSLWAR